MNSLKDKVALITGATSGIGEACAVRFAAAGAKVIVAGRNEQRGQAVVEQIKAKQGEALFVALDVASDESIEAAYNAVEQNYGRLDILFNNAGIFPVAPAFEDLTRDFNSEVFDINLNGTVMVTKRFFDLLRANKGNILNNASVAGLANYNSGRSYTYSASKAGMIKFTQLLARNYGKEIRANCICPGVIRTPIFLHFDESRYVDSIPMGRVGEPEDVASVANFLVSDDAAYLNGCVITIDGGQSI